MTRRTAEDATFWLGALAVFFLLGFMGAYSCTRSHGGEWPQWYTPNDSVNPSRVQRNGNVFVISHHWRVTDAIVSRMIRQPSRRICVHVKPGRVSKSSAISFGVSGGTIYARGNSLEEWLEAIAAGMSWLDGNNETGVVVNKNLRGR